VTLRYVKVLSDLRRLFGDLTGMSIVEIGVGYGGQCRLICEFWPLRSCTLIDLDPVLELADRYLNTVGVEPRPELLRQGVVRPARYDLVISNYAFSELDRRVQDRYASEVVSQADRGYITCNFISSIFGVDSWSRSELENVHPGSHWVPEEPLTSEGNSILVWGDDNTVDSVSDDHLYFNPRLLRPLPDPLGAVGSRWLRRMAQRAARPIRRVIRPLGRRAIEPFRHRRDLAAWRHAGSPVPPPPAFKQRVVRAYGRRYHLKTLIETGTYYGDMVEAQRRRFGRIISIELSRDLHRSAVKRFSNARNVTILEGDSGLLLPRVLSERQEACLFWLDGHYSAGVTARGDLETPILKELDAILSHPWPHVVLVDDARCFGQGDYPSIDGIRASVVDRRPGWTVSVADDIIRIHGPAPPTPTS
jgi:hypothetical protein